MAALVQSYQQSGTVTMLQARPASASGMLQSSQGQGGQPFGVSQQQRNSFYGTPGGLGGSSAYRGSTAPIQPYAFTATPSLATSNQWQQQFQNSRTSSSSSVPTARSLDHNGSGLGRPRHPGASASMTNLHSTSAMGYSSGGSQDDSVLPGSRRVAAHPRPQSAYLTGSATQVTFAQAAPIKISPERYRRPSARTADSSGSVQQAPTQGSAPPSGSGMATVSHLYNSSSNNNNNNSGAAEQNKSSRAPAVDSRPQSFYATATASATDDHPHDEAKRLRRRSMPALDSADYPKPLTPHLFKQPDDSSRPEQLAGPRTADKDIKTARVVVVKSAGASAAGAMQSRNGSSDSLVSSHSGHSRPSSVSFSFFFLGVRGCMRLRRGIAQSRKQFLRVFPPS